MESKKYLLVGGARNNYGTRISKRVLCQNCGKEDHITCRPSKDFGSYCRKCAIEIMNAIEIGSKIKRKMKSHVCMQCCVEFALPVNMIPKKGCICSNCLKGFEIWNGSLPADSNTKISFKIEKRPSGVLIRKK